VNFISYVYLTSCSDILSNHQQSSNCVSLTLRHATVQHA
jgi:hypothetical protein